MFIKIKGSPRGGPLKCLTREEWEPGGNDRRQGQDIQESRLRHFKLRCACAAEHGALLVTFGLQGP